MDNETKTYLREQLGIPGWIIELTQASESKLSEVFQRLDDIGAYNQYKVLSAFQECRIQDLHFGWNTGYGYDDPGRAALEKLYATVFGAQAALVRPTIVSGTHALASVYFGILRPGDELMYCSGRPYDTMETIIGLGEAGQGSLNEFGITYRCVDVTEEGDIDIPAVVEAISPATRMVCVQRAAGYSFRPPVGIDRIREWAAACKAKKPDILCMVDNCYGEFTDRLEPTDAGVDIMAGSLIKNPGGGLALSGGYIAGREDLVRQVSYRVTSPGIGGECGLTFGQSRSMFQGLFLAPNVVCGAMKGAALCAAVFQALGYEVCPLPESQNRDVIQAVLMGDATAASTFCEGVQSASPVDAHILPIAWDMPGYEDPVIMAAGAFVQGSSIELSADGPMREPYIAYFQGGLTYEHARFGVMKTVSHLQHKGIIEPK
ncbi:MAG: methionine gamma-lyase family protein [Anaerovoracaceae bacterium]